MLTTGGKVSILMIVVMVIMMMTMMLTIVIVMITMMLITSYHGDRNDNYLDDGDENFDLKVYAELTITCIEEGKFWIITGNFASLVIIIIIIVIIIKSSPMYYVITCIEERQFWIITGRLTS